MWRRMVLSVGLAAMAALVLGAPALAGGWAITTIDSLPPGGFRADETYRLGYTIRQHGRTPVEDAKPLIRIQSSSGETHVFAGLPDGAPGHYVSEVRFPAAGGWTWEVDQNPFGPQKLGTVTVLPAAAEASAPAEAAILREPAPEPAFAEAPRTDDSAAGIRVALPLAALVVATLIAWHLVAITRRARAAVPERPAVRARAP